MDDLKNILDQCKKGDRRAHDQLYGQYKSMWFGTSLRYSRNQQEAQDIFQEGLLQIFKDLRQYNSEKAAFSTWSNRVLIHAALKYLKRNHWQNTFKNIDELENSSKIPTTIVDEMSAKEITKLISLLPLGYRLVFNMYVIEGYSHKEIAEHLEISVGTSKSQLFKARKTLKNALDSHLINRGYEI